MNPKEGKNHTSAILERRMSTLTGGRRALRRKNALHGMQDMTPKLYPRAWSPQIRQIVDFSFIFSSEF